MSRSARRRREARTGQRRRSVAVHRIASALLAAAVLVVVVTGFGSVTGWWRAVPVLSGSMEPGIRTGGVVLARPEPLRSVDVGEVILFHAPSADRRLVVHRVVERRDVDGEVAFRTKGDANGGPDPWLIEVSGEQVYRVVATAPVLGQVAVWLVDPSIRVAVFALIAALIVGLGLRWIWVSEPPDDLDEPPGGDGGAQGPGLAGLRLRRATAAAVVAVVVAGVVALDASAPADAAFTGAPDGPTPTFTTGSLAAPTPFSCRWNSPTQVQVDWSDASGGFAASTSVQRANSTTGPFSTLGTVGAPGSSYLDTTPGAGTARWYRAVAERGTWSGPPTASIRNGDCRYGIRSLAGGFGSPYGAATDAAGNVYVADTTDDVVRRVAPDGSVTTVAGGGANAACSFTGAATAVALNGPRDVAVDAAGALYVVDTGNDCIRKVTGGTVSRVAGGGATTSCAAADVAAASVRFNNPVGIAVDPGGSEVYVADTGHDCVRLIAGGVSNRFAGGGANGSCAYAGPATSVALGNPAGLALTSTGDLLIADPGNRCLRRVSSGGVSRVAGATGGGASACSSTVAPASFRFSTNQPVDVDLDALDRPYVVQSSLRCATLFDGSAAVPVAGTGTSGSTGDDGKATSATFNNPQGLAVDRGTGDVVIVDTGNDRVRKVARPG